MTRLVLIGLTVCAMGCSSCDNGGEAALAEIRFVSDRTAFENEINSTYSFEVILDAASTNEVTVQYATQEISAKEGADFASTSGTLVFEPGVTSQTIAVPVVIDPYLEPDEQFSVVLSNPVNGFLKDQEQVAIGTIRNDDTAVQLAAGGFDAPTSYPGLNLVWADEFDGPEIDPANWTYDLGANGWGNQELQNYTNDETNSYIDQGNLIIRAEKVSDGQFTSARLKSIDLHEFQFGRVDVRAVLPIGQGIWPAIWMLGANFSEIGWPDCGEIDIMECIGSDPGRVHGTAHWGAEPSQHTYLGGSTAVPFPETLADEYHVYSIEWEQDSIRWYFDNEEYFSISPANMNGQPYPFNEPFFFILNVAVGGIWPGYPDETTPFPGFMAVDYVRVYQ